MLNQPFWLILLKLNASAKNIISNDGLKLFSLSFHTNSWFNWCLKLFQETIKKIFASQGQIFLSYWICARCVSPQLKSISLESYCRLCKEEKKLYTPFLMIQSVEVKLGYKFAACKRKKKPTKQQDKTNGKKKTHFILIFIF